MGPVSDKSELRIVLVDRGDFAPWERYVQIVAASVGIDYDRFIIQKAPRPP